MEHELKPSKGCQSHTPEGSSFARSKRLGNAGLGVSPPSLGTIDLFTGSKVLSLPLASSCDGKMLIRLKVRLETRGDDTCCLLGTGAEISA